MGKDNMILDIIENEEIEYKTDKESVYVHIFDDNGYEVYDNQIVNLFNNKGFKNVIIYHNKVISHDKKLNYGLQIHNDLKITPFIIFPMRSLTKEPTYINNWECVYVWFFYKWIRVYRHDILMI